MHLLIADDEDHIRRLIGRIARAGREVELFEAATGPEAVALVRDHAFDVAVVDLNLPGASGMDVLRALRSTPHGAETPVLLVTGDDPQDDRLRAAHEDPRCILVKKPFTPADLEGILSRAMEMRLTP